MRLTRCARPARYLWHVRECGCAGVQVLTSGSLRMRVCVDRRARRCMLTIVIVLMWHGAIAPSTRRRQSAHACTHASSGTCCITPGWATRLRRLCPSRRVRTRAAPVAAPAVLHTCPAACGRVLPACAAAARSARCRPCAQTCGASAPAGAGTVAARCVEGSAKGWGASAPRAWQQGKGENREVGGRTARMGVREAWGKRERL